MFLQVPGVFSGFCYAISYCNNLISAGENDVNHKYR